MPELNTTFDDAPAWLTADSCRMYISTNRGGGWHIYVASRTPSAFIE